MVGSLYVGDFKEVKTRDQTGPHIKRRRLEQQTNTKHVDTEGIDMKGVI